MRDAFDYIFPEPARTHQPGRCRRCGDPATCGMWHDASFGPGGGIDVRWEIVPGCNRCAAKPIGYEPYPHVLPEGVRPGNARRIA